MSIDLKAGISLETVNRTLTDGFTKLSQAVASPEITPGMVNRPLLLGFIAPNPLPVPCVADLTATLGGVPAGKIWDLRRFVVAATDDHTAVANTFAALYIGDHASMSNLVQTGQNPPFTTLFGSHQAQARGSDRLLVLFSGSGLVAGSSWLIRALAVEVDDNDEGQNAL